MNPVTTPSILTDAIFTAYGGQSLTSTNAQRQAAFCIAEQLAEEELGTYLTGTFVTGTFLWPNNGTLMLPETHLQSLVSVTALHDDGCDCDPIELEGCAYIISPEADIISVRACSGLASCCGCSCGRHPYQVRVVYKAGLAPLASSAPAILQALVMAAQLELDEMLASYRLEGGAGDPGVQAWADASYREERTRLWRTAFGDSPIANHIAKLLKPFRYTRCLSM